MVCISTVMGFMFSPHAFCLSVAGMVMKRFNFSTLVSRVLFCFDF